MKINYIIIPVYVLIASCNNGNMNEIESAASATNLAVQELAFEDMSEGRASDASKSSSNAEEERAEALPEQNEAKIIRTGNLSIESKEIVSSKRNLDQLIRRLGGYYEEENTATGERYTSYDLTVRVPRNNFDSLITGIETGRDKVTHKSIRAEDVSLQYYDLESRLKSKRTYLERYQKMVTNAQSVKELLEIEEQIRLLQEEIESTESTLRHLSGQVQYSTLRVNLFEYQANLPSGSNSFWVRIKDAFIFGWNLIESIALGLVGIWPIILMVIVGTMVWSGYRKRKRG